MTGGGGRFGFGADVIGGPSVEVNGDGVGGATGVWGGAGGGVTGGGLTGGVIGAATGVRFAGAAGLAGETAAELVSLGEMIGQGLIGFGALGAAIGGVGAGAGEGAGGGVTGFGGSRDAGGVGVAGGIGG